VQHQNQTRPARRLARRVRLALLGAAVALVPLAGGCAETDAWMHDPSVVGYWEHTPTKVPVLERISAIEGPDEDFIEIDEIQPEDLMPVVEAYRATTGDIIDVQIWDIPIVNQPALFQPLVDARGFIEIPELGQVFVHGMTSDEIKAAIVERARDLVADPVVTVTITGRRDATYSIIGQVGGPGTYLVPEPDFRLLEAITNAGGVPESIPKLFIIRQVALSDAVRATGEAPPPMGEEEEADRPPVSPDELIDIIDELSDPEGGGGAPAVYATSSGSSTVHRQPETEQPAIDLIEEDEAQAPDVAPEQTGSWMFLNGRWVRVTTPGARSPGGVPAEGEPVGEDTGALVTQRVIEIPTKRLLSGDARYNPVIRPGDVIRVPAPIQGPIYIMGFVNRPGTYTLPSIGNLTLTQAIASAGGLGSIAMPERVDLTRRVDDTHLATIRLNLRAIFERTQPDIFLKPEDTINVGTSFWAFPWAVLRNGFRASYGFGFLLDRNFGNDVFGPPPRSPGVF